MPPQVLPECRLLIPPWAAHRRKILQWRVLLQLTRQWLPLLARLWAAVWALPHQHPPQLQRLPDRQLPRNRS
jgi:hypothetical protein